MIKRMSTTSLAILLLAISFAGCGGMPSRVSGTVTLDGEPLHKGTVAFHPTTAGVTVAAVIDQQGRYTLQTAKKAGLAPGEYRVTVTAISAPPSPTATAEEIAAAFITPRRYSDPTTSGLTHVVERGTATFDIPLTSN